MNTRVATKLEAARARLEELGRLTDELAATHAAVFEEPELRVHLDTFKRAFSEAQARLAEPTLSIATIGTTSSGKSTIINALVGRRIAPIEAGEMSGGVLTLRSGSERRLTVDAADDAPWEAGTWTGISDVDAYNRIRDGVMLPYHEARKSRACLAPQVLSEGPLLPSIDSNLLGLPSDLGVEFIDLPGLNSVQDRANLAVIQTRVHKAFSLVALDYAQTNEEQRKKLLEELTRTVKYLQGRPDSMLFVLNRVDQRGGDDKSIAARISLFRKEIREVLELNHEPDVIPFEARLLYRAQCAWGPVASDGQPEAPAELRLQHLREFFTECASTIERHAETDESLEDWLQGLKKSVRKGQDLTPDEARRLLWLAREWSGGTKLWERLRVRIEESFAELVILPALIEVLDTHRSFTDALRAVSRIRKIDSQEQLERERQRLEQLQTRLHEKVSTRLERFLNRLNGAVENLKTGLQADRQRVEQDLGEGFRSLSSAVDDVTNDLAVSLIAPVRDALKTGRGVHDLEEEMCRVLAPAPAKDLVRAYDLFSRRIPTLRREPKNRFMLRIREDDGAGVERLLETERDVRRLHQSMREALTTRGEFLLQGRAEEIQGALKILLEQQAEDIKTVCLKELPDLSLDQAIESARRVRSRSELLKLPSQLFTLQPIDIGQRQHKQQEVVGKRQEEEEYTERTRAPEGALGAAAVGAAAGFAFGGPLGAIIGGAVGGLVGGGAGLAVDVKKTRTVTRDVTGSVAYKDLEIPDEDGIAHWCSEEVKSAEGLLWEILNDWMARALRESSVSFSVDIKSVLLLADRALEQQQRLANDEYGAVVEIWKRIDWEVDRLVGSRDRLSQAARSEHV